MTERAQHPGLDGAIGDVPTLGAYPGGGSHRPVPNAADPHRRPVGAYGAGDHIGGNKPRSKEVLDVDSERSSQRQRGVDPGQVAARFHRTNRLPAHTGSSG